MTALRFVAVNTMGRSQSTVVLVLAGLLIVGALAIALLPFRDTLSLPGASPDSFSLSCGAPLVAALHGKPVAEVAGIERVVTAYERHVLSRRTADAITVLCRRPARGRLVLSIAGLGAAAILLFVRRKSANATVEEDALIDDHVAMVG